MTDRRDFIRTAALVGGALAVPTANAAASAPRAGKPLDLLILGGTGLTGPHQVRYALARGHKVTVFNRGRRNDRLPAGVTELTGDRNLHQVEPLKGNAWDAVIDNPTTLPFWVRDIGEVLKDRTKQYVFVSTISVYDTSKPQPGVSESSPLVEYANGDPLAVTQETLMKDIGGLYGPMKTASEREARKWFGDRTTIIRPTLIAGPGDSSFRFTYWPYRIAKGGEILAPGDGQDPVQIVDCRDVAEWTIRMVENRTVGTFNAAGPVSTLTMAEQLHGIRGAFDGNREVRFTWAPPDFLDNQKISAWGDMPTWIPRSDPEASAMNADNRRAIDAGLTFRPLATTAVDALDWFKAAPQDAQSQMLKSAGLSAEREREALDAWHKAGR
ncbi:MAG TPA: NAD-dependent epimerase/dehydratase family protein [Casimicrobiaceae bacterium]|jgi:2'-hydroxyisoflavone reductase|nr:NAD-dependent epimerase/dehydratase family protein [Casimicrobiaceae bacterium]